MQVLFDFPETRFQITFELFFTCNNLWQFWLKSLKFFQSQFKFFKNHIFSKRRRGVKEGLEISAVFLEISKSRHYFQKVFVT